MRKSLFNFMELSGIIFCMILVSLLRNLYVFLKGSTAGILFGSVNSSIWEQLKPIILVYIMYGLAELMTARPYFRQFVCAKAIGVYACVLVYILFSRIIPVEYSEPVTLAALGIGFILSKTLTLWDKDISGFFSVACLMLLLIFIMYFSFSAFPPKLDLFLDKNSGMYGIIPDYIDIGAHALSG